jgi:ssDNA-binding replication factor A large subunit
MIRISHGYTKENSGGSAELHVGEKCEVKIDPQDMNSIDYPTISRFATRVSEITDTQNNRRINIEGVAKSPFSATTFERQDLSSGRVMRFILADETGKKPVVVWNEKAEEMEKILKEGDRIQMVNAKVKKTLGGESEIHVDMGTYVQLLPPAEEFSRIGDLKTGFKAVNVQGEVLSRPIVREIKTARQECLKVASFELRDATGRIWVSAWRQHAGTANVLNTGDKVVLKNVYVKKGFGDQLEICTRDSTVMTIIK